MTSLFCRRLLHRSFPPSPKHIQRWRPDWDSSSGLQDFILCISNDTVQLSVSTLSLFIVNPLYLILQEPLQTSFCAVDPGTHSEFLSLRSLLSSISVIRYGHSPLSSVCLSFLPHTSAPCSWWTPGQIKEIFNIHWTSSIKNCKSAVHIC